MEAASPSSSPSSPANREPLGVRISRAHEGFYATVVVVFYTLIALFMDDLRLVVMPPYMDKACEVVAGMILVCGAFLFSFCSSGSFSASHSLQPRSAQQGGYQSRTMPSCL